MSERLRRAIATRDSQIRAIERKIRKARQLKSSPSPALDLQLQALRAANEIDRRLLGDIERIDSRMDRQGQEILALLARQ